MNGSQELYPLRDGPDRSDELYRRSDLPIAFVHTPMSVVDLPEGRAFWTAFDGQYYSAYPGMHPMRADASIGGVMWELPYWAHMLGGVLQDRGFSNTRMLNLYGNTATLTTNSSINSEHVRKTVREQGPAAAYLFSPMTVNYHLAKQIAAVIKTEYPGSKTIFGGVMATPLHEEAAQEDSIDFVVRGAGEQALISLLRAIEDGGNGLEDIGNLTYVGGDGELRVNPQTYPRGIPPEQLPMPQIDLFPAEAGHGLRYLRVVHGLGCLFKCSFCTISTIGQKPQFFPVERVLSEIDAFRTRYSQPLVDTGLPPHHVYYGDETFTQDVERTLALLKAQEERGDITFDAQTRLDRVQDPGVINALGRGGCNWLEVGLESLSLKTREQLKRGHRITEDDQIITLKRLRDAGIATCAFSMTGIPGQTYDEMKANIYGVAELIGKGLLWASYLAMTNPYPGSQMFEDPERYGIRRILHKNYEGYSEDLPPVFTTDQAPDPEIVHSIYRNGLLTLADAMANSPHRNGSINPDILGLSAAGGHS
jgi:anaerobic magnesium-protoporphyrin IX monomethyl ester cyclase